MRFPTIFVSAFALTMSLYVSAAPIWAESILGCEAGCRGTGGIRRGPFIQAAAGRFLDLQSAKAAAAAAASPRPLAQPRQVAHEAASQPIARQADHEAASQPIARHAAADADADSVVPEAAAAAVEASQPIHGQPIPTAASLAAEPSTPTLPPVRPAVVPDHSDSHVVVTRDPQCRRKACL